jgi:cyclic lactone autoinducer peptide
MKSKLYRILIKCGTLLSAIALFTAITTNGAACSFMSYQPDEPEGLAKFVK